MPASGQDHQSETRSRAESGNRRRVVLQSDRSAPTVSVIVDELVAAAAPDRAGSDLAGWTFCSSRVTWLDAGDRLAVDLEDDVVRRHAGVRRRAVAIDVGDDRAAAAAGSSSRRAISGVIGSSFMPKPVAVGCASAARRVRRACGALLGLEIELVDGDVQRLPLLVAEIDRPARWCPAWW